MKSVCIYYFTGSGNTLSIAKAIQTVFINHGYTCVLQRMENTQVKSIEPYSYIGLLFPVAIQSTFPLVWSFVENLPVATNQKIFMIDTLEAFSGGVVGPMRKILLSKGYNCIGAAEIKMSSSMQRDSKKAEEGRVKNEKAIETAITFTRDLIDGKTKWNRIPLASDLMRSISKNRNVWTKQSKQLTVEHEECIMCGTCKRNCPVAAIFDTTGKIVIHHDVCESCMRCVHVCPKNAFRLSGKMVIQNK